jgi:AraC family transcriptional regulator of adaptative response/methylated-DNA-[protein]-cysteine methyltransferase
METTSVRLDNYPATFKSSWLDTPLGQMFAIADEEGLYLLEFMDKIGLQYGVEKFLSKTKSTIIPGTNHPIESIKAELRAYFDGSLQVFKTSVQLLGSPFQKLVWNELVHIPYGQTRSYLEQAYAIEKQGAYRAVANANGANQIVIVIPCHRIINSDGKLGGYSGGLSRKKWLIEHEKQHQS